MPVYLSISYEEIISKIDLIRPAAINFVQIETSSKYFKRPLPKVVEARLWEEITSLLFKILPIEDNNLEKEVQQYNLGCLLTYVERIKKTSSPLFCYEKVNLGIDQRKTVQLHIDNEIAQSIKFKMFQIVRLLGVPYEVLNLFPNNLLIKIYEVIPNLDELVRSYTKFVLNEILAQLYEILHTKGYDPNLIRKYYSENILPIDKQDRSQATGKIFLNKQLYTQSTAGFFFNELFVAIENKIAATIRKLNNAQLTQNTQQINYALLQLKAALKAGNYFIEQRFLRKEMNKIKIPVFESFPEFDEQTLPPPLQQLWLEYVTGKEKLRVAQQLLPIFPELQCADVNNELIQFADCIESMRLNLSEGNWSSIWPNLCLMNQFLKEWSAQGNDEPFKSQYIFTFKTAEGFKQFLQLILNEIDNSLALSIRYHLGKQLHQKFGSTELIRKNFPLDDAIAVIKASQLQKCFWDRKLLAQIVQNRQPIAMMKDRLQARLPALVKKSIYQAYQSVYSGDEAAILANSLYEKLSARAINFLKKHFDDHPYVFKYLMVWENIERIAELVSIWPDFYGFHYLPDLVQKKSLELFLNRLLKRSHFAKIQDQYEFMYAFVTQEEDYIKLDFILNLPAPIFKLMHRPELHPPIDRQLFNTIYYLEENVRKNLFAQWSGTIYDYLISDAQLNGNADLNSKILAHPQVNNIIVLIQKINLKLINTHLLNNILSRTQGVHHLKVYVQLYLEELAPQFIRFIFNSPFLKARAFLQTEVEILKTNNLWQNVRLQQLLKSNRKEDIALLTQMFGVAGMNCHKNGYLSFQDQSQYSITELNLLQQLLTKIKQGLTKKYLNLLTKPVLVQAYNEEEITLEFLIGCSRKDIYHLIQHLENGQLNQYPPKQTKTIPFYQEQDAKIGRKITLKTELRISAVSPMFFKEKNNKMAAQNNTCRPQI